MDVAAMIRNGARFQNHLKVKDEEKAQLLKDFEVRARDMATKMHEASRRGNRRNLAATAEAYKDYLSLYASSKHKMKIKLNRASALFEHKDYLQAGLQYEDAALSLKEGKKRRETIYQAILAYFNSIDADTVYRRKHPTRKGLLDKLSLLRAREGLKQMGAYYVKKWPKDARTAKVKFNVASMHYQQGEYERGSELLTAFVKQYPTHKDAVIAARLALDSLNKMDDLEGLAKLALEFSKNSAIRDSGFRSEAARIAQAARKRKIEMTVIDTTDGDFGEKMLEEWENHKGTQQGEEFLYTAFVKYKNEGNVAGVFDFGGRLIGAYPKSTKLVDVFGTMGNFAARAADFERAAVLFHEFYKRFPRQKNALQLLGSSANFRLFLGDYDRAAALFGILRGSGSAAQRREAHEKLMDIYRRTHNWQGLQRAARAALQADPRWLTAAYSLGLAYLGQENTQPAERELSRAAGLSARNAKDKESKARSYFELGELLQRRFATLVASDPAQAEALLQRRFEFLEAMERYYVAAIETGSGEWGIASLHALARAYDNFGSSSEICRCPAG